MQCWCIHNGFDRIAVICLPSGGSNINLALQLNRRQLQGEELEPARKRAEEFGVKEIYIDDLREEFVRDYVFPMFRCTQMLAS